MVGDTVVSDGVEFEVVWDGGEGLIGDRMTKPSGFWTPPKRLYNKKSEYWNRKKGDPNAEVLCDSGETSELELDN